MIERTARNVIADQADRDAAIHGRARSVIADAGAGVGKLKCAVPAAVDGEAGQVRP